MPTYSWITPKTNWTSSDYYNATDLNRVENNIAYVRQQLAALNYTMPVLVVNTSRVNTDFDYVSSINRIENNMDAIRLAFVTPSTWQPAITWTSDTKFTHSEANRWESNVSALNALATVVPQAFRYAGTFISGQEVLPQT